MKKEHKGKRCVYCSVAESATSDHIICKEFFTLEQRQHPPLPQVPACFQCNNDKSKLEAYMTAVMPFGASHSRATASLDMVVPRLAGNKKLHRELGASFAKDIDEQTGETKRVSIGFDGIRAGALFNLIAKGLYGFHFGGPLPETHGCMGTFVSAAGEEWYDKRLFLPDSKERITGDLGAGTFIYEGVRLHAIPEVTVWRMSLYGCQVGGGRDAPEEISRQYVAFTAPAKLTPALNEAMRKHGIFGA